VPSAAITTRDILELINERRNRTDVVVLQVTDTIEATAFLFDVLWDSDAPFS
jgi:L-asparaginase/Glu-tRNA(Gln) amidotransferase subunit D